MSESLRICMVTDAYLPSVGGIENHVFNLTAELKRMGHDVVVVTHKEPPVPSQVARQVESPVPVRRLAGGLLMFREHDIAMDPRMVSSFRRLLTRERFDVVHGQSEGSYLVYEALAVARRRGIPTVLTRHSILRAKIVFVRTALIALTKVLVRRADGLIAVSHSCAEESRGFRGQLRVIPNGVDTAAFRPSPATRAAVRSSLGLRDEHTVVGFIGRLHSTKGVALLLDVFGRLRRKNPNARLVLAGPGPLRPIVEAAADASSGAITLLDPLPYDKVASILSAFDVFALPSRGEAFGISLLEAMACGIASVAFGRWGVLDLVVDGESGLLATGPVDFAEKLHRLVEDADLRRRMGAGARTRAEKLFSWPAVAAETVALYRELIGAKKRS